MRYVIKVIEPLGKIIQPLGDNPSGTFVVRCDVDSYDGRGALETTVDVSKARSFATQGEAIKYVCRQSEVRPLRDDGRPNRPLTAFTVSIEPVETLH